MRDKWGGGPKSQKFCGHGRHLSFAPMRYTSQIQSSYSHSNTKTYKEYRNTHGSQFLGPTSFDSIRKVSGETLEFALLQLSIFLSHQTFHITTPLEVDFGSVQG